MARSSKGTWEIQVTILTHGGEREIIERHSRTGILRTRYEVR